jgi:FkbM family methyltransferase
MARRMFSLIKNLLSREYYILWYLKRKPRYTPGVQKLGRNKFIYVDAVSFAWQYKEIFEREIYNFLPTGSDIKVIDCGANIGVSVMYFANKFPGCSIDAFEPDNKIFKILTKNVEKITSSEIRLHNVGVLNKNGIVQFVAEGADGGHIAVEDVENHSDSRIQVVSLRPFLSKKISFLKIDIEGSETLVLNDVSDLLFNVENIFVEYHSVLGHEQELDQLLHILKQAGFRTFLESATLENRMPFIERSTINKYDNLLNIYGYR